MKQKFAAGRALYVKGQVVPGIADGMTWDAAGHPVFLLIVPGVPFISAKDPAFMTPDVGFAANELVNVKLKRLRVVDIAYPEVDVIGEVMQVRDDGFVCVFDTMR